MPDHFQSTTFSEVTILKLAPEFVQYCVSMDNGGFPKPPKVCGGSVHQAEALRKVSEWKNFRLKLSFLTNCKMSVSEHVFSKLAIEFVATCTHTFVHVQWGLTKV